MKSDIPVACSLTGKELQFRRKVLLNTAGKAIIGSSEVDRGLRFNFSLSRITLKELAAIIELERDCCPFLNFSLTLNSGENTAVLDLTGPAGTREIIRSLFDWN